MAKKTPDPEQQLQRVREMCAAFPGSTEKLSHGEPTFFLGKRVFAMFSDHHHDDGHLAVLIPLVPDMQQVLIEEDPEVYYRPPYVGVKGWVGIELTRIGDDALSGHLGEAWKLIATKKK